MIVPAPRYTRELVSIGRGVVLVVIAMAVPILVESVSADVPDTTSNLSRPSAHLDSSLRIEGTRGVIESPTGSYEFSVDDLGEDSPVRGEWISDSPARPARPVIDFSGRVLRPHASGFKVISDGIVRVVSLDGYRANEFLVRNRTVWIATLGGLYVWSPDLDQPERILNKRALSVVTAKNHLFVLTPEALYRGPSPGWDSHPIPGPAHNHVSAVVRTADRLVVGTFNHGLSILDGDGWSHFQQSLPSPQVNAVTEFRGTTWVATTGGLGEIVDGRLVDRTPRWWLDPVADVVTDGNDLFICGGGSMGHFDESGWNVEYDPSYPSWQTAAPFEGTVVCGGMEGLGIMEGDTLPGPAELAQPWITALEAQDTRLWIGTYDSDLSVFSRASGLSRVDHEVWVTPRSIVSAEDGLIVGTRGDGIRFYESGRYVGSIMPAESSMGGEVTALSVGDDGLWVGMRSGLQFLTWGDVRRRLDHDFKP